MTKDHEVRIEGGKFTFIAPADHPTVRVIDRIEPDPWVYFVDKALAVLAMMRALDAARVVVQAARKLVEQHMPQPEECKVLAPLAAALLLHDSLTSDREPPSAWCGVEAAPPEKCPRCWFTPCRKMFQCSESDHSPRPGASVLRDAVHSAIAGALHDKEPCWSVEQYRAICDEIAGRVLEAIEEVQEQASAAQVAEERTTANVNHAIDTAPTLKDLTALMMSLAGKLGYADNEDAERRYYQRKAWLETQASAETAAPEPDDSPPCRLCRAPAVRDGYCRRHQ